MVFNNYTTRDEYNRVNKLINSKKIRYNELLAELGLKLMIIYGTGEFEIENPQQWMLGKIKYGI